MTASLTLQIKGVENPQDPDIKNDLEIACKYVLRIFETKVARVPPLGVKPIIITPAPDNIPRFCLDKRLLEGQYYINLTCLNARCYDQLVYQFAHELCHVYMLPNDLNEVVQYILKPPKSDGKDPWTNWFAESICFTMSYLCLRMMPEEWKKIPPPFPNRITYPPNFARYRQRDICNYLSELKIPSEDGAAEWLQLKLPTLIKECTEGDRAEQSVCAIVLERIFLRRPKSWGAICRLGDCIDRPNTDFNRWYNSTTSKKKQHELVKAIAQTFDLKRSHKA